MLRPLALAVCGEAASALPVVKHQRLPVVAAAEGMVAGGHGAAELGLGKVGKPWSAQCRGVVCALALRPLLRAACVLMSPDGTSRVAKFARACAVFNALWQRGMLFFVREKATGNAPTSSNQAELLVGELCCVGLEDHDWLELHLQCSTHQ